MLLEFLYDFAQFLTNCCIFIDLGLKMRENGRIYHLIDGFWK